MKNLSKMLLVATTCFMTSRTLLCAQDTPTPPAWYSPADDIMSQVSTMPTTFQQDSSIYQAWVLTLSDLQQRFDARETELDAILTRAKTDFNTAVSTIGGLQEANAQQIITAQAAQRQLEDQIAYLTQTTTAQISSLQAQIDALNQQLNQARQAYASLVDFDTTKAQALISSLQSAQTAYTNMLNDRNALLTELQSISDRIRAFSFGVSNDIADMNSFLNGLEPSLTTTNQTVS